MKHVAAIVALGVALGAPAWAQDGEAGGERPQSILVFGDSLTWGWTPSDPVTPTTRHPVEDRWTTAMAEALGAGYSVVVEGLSGRTTNIDDPTDPRLNGADYLPSALVSHDPLDLVIIMLGTNDTKTYLERTPLEIALGAGELINMVHEMPWSFTEYDAPQVLLISPPPLGDEIGAEARDAFDAASQEKSGQLADAYAQIAELAGEHFFDAGTVIETDGIDGIHFTAEANATLGEAVAAQVEEILGAAAQ